MDLNSLWFILIAVLFIGYFFLEGFDFGVGILLPFLGKEDTGRRVIINTIGPHWDANEVWLLVAGGATFAAFPNWYATMFSGFYLALLLMLVALIVRVVAFEFRSKDKNPAWRKAWDWLIFAGSLAPALLWGVAFANLIRGVPIDANMQYAGGFWNLLNPYALLGGLAGLATFTLHGATFLSLKTDGALHERAHDMALRLWLAAVALLLAFFVASIFATDLFSRLGAVLVCIPLAVTLLAAGWLLRQKRDGWAFVMTGLTIALAAAAIFLGLYPRVMVSSLNPEWSLTVYTTSSSPYTLRVMTIVAAIFGPIVLLYQAWTYRVFRKRVRREDVLEY